MKEVSTKTLQNKKEMFRRALNATDDSYEINNIVEEYVTTLLDCEYCSLWYYDADAMELVRKRSNNTKERITLQKKVGIIYKCFMTQKAEIYNYLASHKDYVAEIDNPDNIKIRSKVIVPIFNDKKLVGIVTGYNSIKKTKKFRLGDVEKLEELNDILLHALAKIHAFKEVTKKAIEPKEEKESLQKESSDETLLVVANFIHDLKTPANTLYGFLELLEGQIEDKRLKEYVINAKESATFINELTVSMLDRISLHKERNRAKKEENDLLHFFCSIAEMYTSNMYRKKIAYNVFIDPLMPKNAMIDTLKLKRVLMNLVSNAYKFTPNGGKIEYIVKYLPEKKSLYIAVKDTGIGIEKEQQQKIFEAFTQAKETTAFEYGGSGLGLSISSEYVKDMSGELRVESELEKGSLFSFVIPLQNTTKEPCFVPLEREKIKIAILFSVKNSFGLRNIMRYFSRFNIERSSVVACSSVEKIPHDATHVMVYQHKMQEYLQANLSKKLKTLIIEEELFSINSENSLEDMIIISEYGCIVNQLYKFLHKQKAPKILLVDDDKTSILLLEKILENEFCEIEVARNGKIALEMIIDAHKKFEPYSIVFIDNNMPQMSGCEAMQRVREFERDNRLKSVYAVSTSGDILDLSKEGRDFDCYIGKPFRMQDIREILNKTKEYEK